MRNVLVSGASRGIGLAIAQRLCADGFNVIGLARNHSDEFRAAQQAASAAAGGLHFRQADLADVDAIAGLVRGIKAEFGAYYGLVNNAGLSQEGLLAILTQRQIESMVRLNTLSPMLLTKFAVRSMMAEGRGRVINISSIMASTGFSGLSVYGATKAGMVGFTRSLAREVGRVGVTVNSIAPGFIDTEMTASMGEAERAKIAGRSALGRLAQVHDIANAASFLMSEAAANITGTVLTVDAGSTA